MATETGNIQKEVLKHGEYMVKVKRLNTNNEIEIIEKLVKPLTYDDMAEGWIRVTPRRKRVVHHFSIYLSQLPMNLWWRVKRTFTCDQTKDYYKKIKDGNYHYTIKYTINDDKIFKLYRQIMSKTPDLEKIREMYKELDNNRVKGWIMMYTLNMIKQWMHPF